MYEIRSYHPTVRTPAELTLPPRPKNAARETARSDSFCFAAACSSRNWMNNCLTLADTHKTFRRSTGKLEITKIDIEKIWRRIHLAELTINGKSLCFTLNLYAAAWYSLN